MDWANERYVRVYVRDTADWLLLSWEARALWLLLLRKLDRAGVMDLGRHGAKGVAAAVGMPFDVVERALPELLEDGCIVVTKRDDLSVLVAPNYLEAQEAVASDAQRKRESRARRREHSLNSVTKPDDRVTNPPVPVTRGHVESRAVTDGHSVPSRAVPSRAVPSHKEQSPARLRPVRLPSGDHQTFVARFTELFQGKNLGASPNWKGKAPHGMVQDLLKRDGGLQEALKRAENMFAAPPAWPPPPHDLATLVRHWDRFAQPHRPATGRVGHYQHTGEEEYAGGEVDL